MIIFHHNDGDGKCAASLILTNADHVDEYPITLFEINYGTEFPFELIHANEQVFILDYSISTGEMDKLYEITDKIVWIDHHKTAILDYEKYGRDIPGIRRIGTAGCVLTYEYLNGATCDIPYFVQLIGAFDVWNFTGCCEADAKNFIKGLDILDTHPESSIWKSLYDTNEVEDIIETGTMLRAYDDFIDKKRCEAKGFDYELNGYKCFCLNQSRVSGDTFKSVEGNYDVYIGFSYDGKNWAYSLRSARPCVDVSELAAIYGGGGHVGAAGMVTKEFILKGD